MGTAIKKNLLRYRIYKSEQGFGLKIIIEHPMESGQRKDKKTGKLIPSDFIEDINFYLNSKHLMQMKMGVNISQNPYVHIGIPEVKKGDSILIEWRDNHGVRYEFSDSIKDIIISKR